MKKERPLRVLVALYAILFNGLMLAAGGGLFNAPVRNYPVYFWFAVPSWLVLTWTALSWVDQG